MRLAMLSLFSRFPFGSKQLVRLVLLLYVGMILLLVASTFIASAVGEHTVFALVYGAWWFKVWWATLAAALLLAMHCCSGAVAHLHFSFFFMLLGAGLTASTSRRERVPSR